MTWPAPDYVDGEFLDYLDMRTRVKQPLDDLNSRLAVQEAATTTWAQAYRNTAASIANNAWAVLGMNVATLIEEGGWTVSNGGLVVPAGKGGDYDIEAQVAWAANATGVRRINVRLNSDGASVGTGQAIRAFNVPPNAFDTYVPVQAQRVSLVPGDVIHMFVFQNSGAALAVNLTATDTFIHAQRSR